ncbi:hypothetical protein AMS69_14085 [Haloarcula rubripromontorii]|uniref:Uncharacterized protein n=1 Tax=Haloarcula rubripromontorii TaxID=1705562 RepID=A0A0N1IUM2_9EURY|nr:hypothetical protein [Haloarcula rubripromontorii]KOX92476.1 hypothetical protein AMS69_14085 [Haloarcula rubripromontorii]
MSRARHLELLTLLGTGLLILAVAVVSAVPSATKYEISIYGALPSYFWVSIVGALFVGGLVILLSAAEPADTTWQPALALMILSNLVLFLMPFLRGYQMYGREDPMSHLGYIRDFVVTGEIGANIYPPAHVLAVTVSDATGLDWMTVVMVLSPVFSLLYYGAMFYLLRTVFDSRREMLFGIPFVMLPVLRFAHLGFRPFALSIMLIPFSLYLLFKSDQSATPATRTAFVIVLFAQTFYHPLTALFVIGVFVLYRGSNHVPSMGGPFPTTKNLFSISVALFAVWYTQYAGILLRFKRIYTTLFGVDQGEPPVAAYQQTIQESSPALIDILRVILFKYGVEFMLFGLGFTFTVAAAALVWKGRYVPTPHLGMFTGTVVVFSFGGLLFLVSDLIVPPNRPFQIAKIGAIVLVGQLLYVGWIKIDWSERRIGRTVGFWPTAVVVLLLLASLSTFSVYKSPLSSERNPQVTEMELEGSAWLMGHGEATENLDRFGITFHRHHDYRNGVQTSDNFDEGTPPSHFNYTTRQYLGSSYDSDHYLTITRKGRITYPELFPGYRDRWRYTPGDFDQLERDQTVNRLYDNGDYTQYLVNATANDGATASPN